MPATKNLIVLDDYKAYKSISSTEGDSRISAVIASTSAFIKNYCGRTFVDYSTTDKTEYISGNAKKCFYLDEYPVIGITSINSSIDNQVTQTLLVNNTDYYLDSETGLVESALGNFDAGFHSIEIKYKGGYADIPEDLKLAALDLTAHYLEQQFKPKMSTGVSISENVSSGEMPVQIPFHIKNTLDLYRTL